MLAEPDLRGLLGAALRSEGVRPDDDGEPQQGAGAVVHGQVMSDHLQVHDVLPGAGERLGEHQHGANVARTLRERRTSQIAKHFLVSLWGSDLFSLQESHM